ncbi:MAG: hypothetical protein FJ216_11345 [Ignavibacteria bacterium]|nr:hypothetical protein [Ignavibacteria bacterium]
MDISLKNRFLEKWEKYFGDAELPITFYYHKGNGGAEQAIKSSDWRCFVCDLSKVRNGKSLYFDKNSLPCGGAKRYLGYEKKLMPNFEYFLSCGIPGKMEGERYIRTPEMVRQIVKNQFDLPIEGKNLIAKRWDNLDEKDEPEVIVFFAKPDVLSGLFTLANYDQIEPNGVYCPFGAGCSSIIHYAYREKDKERPRAVIGLFDVSARPCVPENVLTFSVPMIKFEKMIDYMDESFLITESWNKVRKRIKL